MTELGIVTYNIAKDWDLPTILSRLEKLGYGGVELRCLTVPPAGYGDLEFFCTRRLFRPTGTREPTPWVGSRLVQTSSEPGRPSAVSARSPFDQPATIGFVCFHFRVAERD